ncbi:MULTISPECIES: tRNA-dihydrouridine synthase [unclassified Legionella]|uniref:tRNA dihydrouridine synthase n=1 Tax=unclassified Legionella TaxID=2622702 RepID=UPI001055A7C5|nr:MULTISPECIES: tRNA-dihydrouridine synthase family protein [unclassified Legionella]MDI9819642.1 tRNA-dihydrouridine synthase family protein [Legionella sp. PL877]
MNFLGSPLSIGKLQLANRLIQGPLAGFSCAPFRELFYQYTPPAYCVTEMVSAHDVLHKHKANSRYLFRSAKEKTLCYQISGSDPVIMAQASACLEQLGADLIDINCGCPKSKIRKKGAGSALLDKPQQLAAIISKVRATITIPLTVKIRIQRNATDIQLARAIEEAGADAIIVHGRHWADNYDNPSDFNQIAKIKSAVSIPVIANGDIFDRDSLLHALKTSLCDGYMVSRAGTGKPWLFEHLLEEKRLVIEDVRLKALFMQHLQQLAGLENEHKALLQSKSLFRYYFKPWFTKEQLHAFYALENLAQIASYLQNFHFSEPLSGGKNPSQYSAPHPQPVSGL